jgi:agmatinase
MSITYALPNTFLGIDNNDRDAGVCIVGVPYDFGTSNRPGTRFGPDAIRSASRMLADGDHPIHRVDPKLVLDIADVGNVDIEFGDIQVSLAKIEQQIHRLAHPISLGGDHSIALPILRALAQRYDRDGPLGVVHFDAHMDTWPGPYFGHGNPFYHAINEGLIDPNRMIQIGIRSPIEKEVYDWTIAKGVTVITGRESDAVERIKQVVGDGLAYLTLDIDCLDPSCAPGTGTPEIGGLETWRVQQILRGLTGLNFVGMDMVEVSPPYDVAEITALAAATFVWEYLALLALRA